MEYQLRPLGPDHKTSVMDIFNYYIQNSFSAFFTTCLPHGCFDALLQACRGYPALAVEDEAGKAVGFGMLKPFHPGDAVKRTAELSYFIAPDCTRQGLGGMLLEKMTEEARKMGIDNLVASVSSQNEASLRFHQQNGFLEAGRIRSAGRKFEQEFDIVIFQKRL